MRQFIHSFDKRVTTNIVMFFGPNMRPLFKAVTALGDPITILVFAGCLGVYSYIESNLGLLLGSVMIPATLVLGALLKVLFERVRPLNDYVRGMRLKTYSFPSGHSSGAMVAYGLLAYVAFMSLSMPLSIIAGSALLAAAMLVGVSRVYLGAHFPTDVIAGWLLGAVAVLVVIFVIRPFV